MKHMTYEEGSSKEERAETHEQEMAEQAKGMDWDKTVDPTVTHAPKNKGSTAQD